MEISEAATTATKAPKQHEPNLVNESPQQQAPQVEAQESPVEAKAMDVDEVKDPTPQVVDQPKEQPVVQQPQPLQHKSKRRTSESQVGQKVASPKRVEAPISPFMDKIMQALGGSTFATRRGELLKALNARQRELMERDYAYLMDKHKLSKNRVRKRWGKEVKADCTSASRTDFCGRLMELQLEPADVGIVWKDWGDDNLWT